MKRILPTLAIGLLTLLPALVFALDGFPAFPMAFWGNITINGQSAPIGTTIRAYYGSALAGTVVVREPGIYGYTESAKQKFVVGEGTGAITFTFQSPTYSNGVETTGDSAVTYQGFTSGLTTQKDIAFTLATPTVLPLAISANGNGTFSATLSGATEASVISAGIATAVVIPANATISGPPTWNGKFVLPVAVSSYTLTANSGNTAMAVEVIEVGAGDTPLTIDQPVKLVFTG